MARYGILEEYVKSQQTDIDQGKPVVVEVRELDTFERLITKSLIAPPGKQLEGGAPLTVLNLAENVVSDAWKILVLEELDSDSIESKAQSDYRKSAPPGA
ncbi:MAG: hypothetical protein NTY41_08240 [Proteobacteria bacterium]|nr:hypothetical protein [Pseudomonadota bacterium]